MQQRKLHTEERDSLYFTPNIIRFINWWEMRGRTCSTQDSDYAGSSEDGRRARRHLKDLSVHSGTGLALQWHVTSLDENGLIRPRTGTGEGKAVCGSCEHGYELLGSIRGQQVFQ